MDAPVRLRGLDQQHFSVRLPREYYDAYERLADEHGTTVYEACRKVLMAWQDQRAAALAEGKPFSVPTFTKTPPSQT
jgi:hypothetical protein